mmetsp:Transcript_32481/g.74660  ORF Transcript_32481/g.74660 Transcript_32481/m.74660 type:complete len:203 (-) Transcript_32481:1390-1998(-)
MPKSATFGRVLAVSALAGGAETFAPNAFGVRSSSTGLAAVASDDAALSRGRRKALHSSLCICATCVGTSAAVALDMDSFANSQVRRPGLSSEHFSTLSPTSRTCCLVLGTGSWKLTRRTATPKSIQSASRNSAATRHFASTDRMAMLGLRHASVSRLLVGRFPTLGLKERALVVPTPCRKLLLDCAKTRESSSWKCFPFGTD